MSAPIRMASDAQQGARNNADRTALHQGRPVTLRGHRVPPDHERDPQSGWLGGVQGRERRGSGVLVAGGVRRSGAEVFPQGRRALAPEEGRGRDRAVLAVALGRRRGTRSPSCPRTSASSARYRRKQVFDRLAGTWTYWGWKGGYFDSEADAQAFFDEHRYMLAMQMCAPNSPQWFNTGLHWAYGIDGPSQGHYYVDFKTGKLTKSKTSYEHPQPHACFIQSINDDLVNEGGIMDLWVREARLFKYGSGTGTNFSRLRGEGERLAGGGKSSGLMSFLKIGDRAAGAIKSGGTTRRAAKMVIVDTDHPDIEQFIDWKVPRGAEGRGARHRLQDQPEAPQGGAEGLRQLRGLGRRLLPAGEEPRAEARDQARAPQPRAGQPDPARHPVRASRATPTSTSRSTTPTGTARPISPSPARTPTTPCASPTSSSKPSKPTATGT